MISKKSAIRMRPSKSTKNWIPVFSLVPPKIVPKTTSAFLQRHRKSVVHAFIPRRPSNVIWAPPKKTSANVYFTANRLRRQHALTPSLNIVLLQHRRPVCRTTNFHTCGHIVTTSDVSTISKMRIDGLLPSPKSRKIHVGVAGTTERCATCALHNKI